MNTRLIYFMFIIVGLVLLNITSITIIFYCRFLSIKHNLIDSCNFFSVLLILSLNHLQMSIISINYKSLSKVLTKSLYQKYLLLILIQNQIQYFINHIDKMSSSTGSQLASLAIGSSIMKAILIFSSKKSDSNFSAFDRSLEKNITKIFYCSSPLEDTMGNSVAKSTLNFLSFSTRLHSPIFIGLGDVLLRHEELIFEVDEEIYYLVYFGEEGMLIFKGLSLDQLLQIRNGNKVTYRKTPSYKTKVKQLVNYLKKMRTSSYDYDKFSWNCKDFSRSLWQKF